MTSIFTRRGRISRAAALAFAVLSALAACAPKPSATDTAPSPSTPNAPAPFTVPLTAPVTLHLRDGLLALSADGAVEPGRALARVASGASAFVAAADGVGMFRVRIEDGSAVVEPPLGAELFSGRSVGSLFASDKSFVCQLFVDDFREGTTQAATPLVASLGENGTRAEVIHIPANGTPLTRVFAVFPVTRDSWLVQTRTLSGDRVLTAYFNYRLSKDSIVPIDRDSFERAPLAPASALPPAAAQAVSGPPAIVFLRKPDGSRSVTRAGSGDQADAVEWYAAGDDGRSICVSRAGVAYAAAGKTVTALDLRLPVAGAVVADAALLPGALAVVWQEDRFPDVGASGLVLVPLD